MGSIPVIPANIYFLIKMFGLMFLAAFLANIVFLLVVCGIGYFIYKKNENTIKETKTHIQIICDEIESILNTAIDVGNTVINDVENIKPSLDYVNSSIGSINNILKELKDKLNKFPF